jgi:hypothetical protein
MEIEPVYVAAPSAQARCWVSRRAFLTGVLGSLGLGSAMGAHLGSRSRVPPSSTTTETDAATVPFVEDCVAWADAPLEELASHAPLFLIVFGATEDPRLVPGLERLAAAVVARHPTVADQRATLAAALAAEIAARPAAHDALLTFLPALRAIR